VNKEIIQMMWKQIKTFRHSEGNLKDYAIYMPANIKKELFPNDNKFGGLPIKICNGMLERQDKTGTKYADIVICDIKNLAPGFAEFLFNL
jgi:hypothetical protein